MARQALCRLRRDKPRSVGKAVYEDAVSGRILGMLTIAWLIRSNQGIMNKGDITPWQDDWFVAFLVTVVTFMIDGIIVWFVIYSLSH